MKKHNLIMVLLLLVSSLLFAQGAIESTEVAKEQSLTIYSYDSFASEWGPGPTLIPLFEEKTGIKINLVSCGDAGEMIAKVLSEGKNCPADIILGISDDQSSLLLSKDILKPYNSPALANIDELLLFDDTKCLLPFDFGAFSLVYDSQSKVAKPTSLEDLTKSEYKDKFILIDPRTSSVGLGLLFWSVEVFGDDYLNWWKQVKENALTITDGWSTAYGLFTEGEAPLVLSYTTSPVYHVLWEDTTRYEAVIFDEGHYMTIEAAGILKSSKNEKEAQQFIDFILTEGQKEIAVANSMYPVNKNTELPSAYDYAPLPSKLFQLDKQYIAKNLDRILKEWTEVMSK